VSSTIIKSPQQRMISAIQRVLLSMLMSASSLMSRR
jgi:hypothetical protein